MPTAKSRDSIIRNANATLIAKGKVDAVERFFTADYVAHLGDRDLVGGHDGVRRYLKMLFAAFPQVEVQVEVLVQEGDRLAWLRTMRGVQKGGYQGFPASGREIVWRDMVTSEFRDGLIAEEWIVTDLAERLLLSRKSGRKRSVSISTSDSLED